jgi:hypothetical protein
MTPFELVDKCKQIGLSLTVDDGELRVRGKPDTVANYAPLLRLHKEKVISLLTGTAAEALIAELIEVDGLSAVDAAQIAMDGANIRPAEEWLAMIKEVDELVAVYCERFKLDDEARRRIMQARHAQSLFSIAQTLEWFRKELADDQTEGA